MFRGQLSASVGLCHIGHGPMSTEHGTQQWSISPLPVAMFLVDSSKENHGVMRERMDD